MTNPPDYDTTEKHAFNIRVRTADKGGLGVENTFTVILNDLNEPPTDITLDGNEVDENLYPPVVAVGTFSTEDINPGDSHAYALVSGEGDAENGLFRIVGNTLRTTTKFDYEGREGRSCAIRVLTNDGHGGTFAKPFTITLNDVNDAPTISAIEDADLRGFGNLGGLTTDPLPFFVTDQDASDGNLTLTAESDNPDLLPAESIVFGGSGEERTHLSQADPGRQP